MFGKNHINSFKNLPLQTHQSECYQIWVTTLGHGPDKLLVQSSFYLLLDDPRTRWFPLWQRLIKKHLKKKKIAPAKYTAEVVCIDQIIPKSTWLNRELIFLIFFVARFERNLILHTAGEWWVRWAEIFCTILYRFGCVSGTYIYNENENWW